jgi:hypothetical protein
MQLDETEIGCQLPCLPRMAIGPAEVPPESIGRKIKLEIRRRVSPSRERVLRIQTNDLMNRFAARRGKPTKPTAAPEALAATNLQPGEAVRVRSMDEIRATLDNWGQLKGCGFMPEMEQYCGTKQRIYKRVERFVDERDLRVKHSKGIVFLEGVICEGTADFGPCDRSCLLFWREEWLERLE